MKHLQSLLAVLALAAASAHAYEPAGTPDDWPMPMMGHHPYTMLVTDRLEAGFSDEADTYLWDVQGWYGGDGDRWWLKTEGEGETGQSPEHAELQLLFSRMFAPFWDWRVGVRHDFRPQPDRSHLVIGIQGLAPYRFEIDSALFLSDEGDVSGRFEAEYDLRITQWMVLQPRFELNAAFSGDPEIGIASGINATEFGLRVRYEIRREFAPYIGIAWERLYGATADLARDEGEHTSSTSFVVGVRAWF
jgi:copper resistance protein B